MSYFKAKMHQIRVWLELHPRSHWGSSQRFPDLLSGFEGILLLTEGEKCDGREGGRDGRKVRLCHGFWGMNTLQIMCFITLEITHVKTEADRSVIRAQIFMRVFRGGRGLPIAKEIFVFLK